jgi:integrase
MPTVEELEAKIVRAHGVRRSKHVVKKGKTAIFSAEETREFLSRIDIASVVGLRDRALIALLIYTFARVGAAIAMRVEDVYVPNKFAWLRLHEKGGKRHDMPAHHNLEAYLDAYITAAGLASDPKGPLFRSTVGRSGELADRPLQQPDVHRMISCRATAADIRTRIGCHTFRATGTRSICETAVSSRLLRLWRITQARGRRASVTGERIKYLSMKSNGS